MSFQRNVNNSWNPLFHFNRPKSVKQKDKNTFNSICEKEKWPQKKRTKRAANKMEKNTLQDKAKSKTVSRMGFV